jgi:hypothetical protein
MDHLVDARIDGPWLYFRHQELFLFFELPRSNNMDRDLKEFLGGLGQIAGAAKDLTVQVAKDVSTAVVQHNAAEKAKREAAFAKSKGPSWSMKRGSPEWEAYVAKCKQAMTDDDYIAVFERKQKAKAKADADALQNEGNDWLDGHNFGRG